VYGKERCTSALRLQSINQSKIDESICKSVVQSTIANRSRVGHYSKDEVEVEEQEELSMATI
jgi:hypothetical protein